MEYLDEQSRYESGCLSRELEIPLAIIALEAVLNDIEPII